MDSKYKTTTTAAITISRTTQKLTPTLDSTTSTKQMAIPSTTSTTNSKEGTVPYMNWHRRNKELMDITI